MGTCIGPFVFAIAKAGKAYDIAYPRTLRDGVAKSETLSKEVCSAFNPFLQHGIISNHHEPD